jgi:hypothetical protein
MYIEFIIKQSKRESIVCMRNSLLVATMIYGLMNSSILYCLYKLKSHRFWFINLSKSLETDECYHQSPCKEHLRKDIKQTAIFAFGISLFKLLMPRIKMLIASPSSLFQLLLKKFDYGLFMFLFSSNALFKASFCWLNRMNKFSKPINCTLAGMLSSFGYIFFPRYICFTMGITTTIEVGRTSLNNLNIIEIHF